MQKNQSEKGGVKISDLVKNKNIKPTNLVTKEVLLKAQNSPRKVLNKPKDTKQPKPKSVRKPLEIDPSKKDLMSLQKPYVYLAFTNWIAMPETTRFPKTQGEFAKEYKVDENSLSLWKKRPNFWRTVENNVKEQWREKTGQAVQSLYRNLLVNGDSKEFLAFMSYVNGFNPKTSVEDVTPPENKYDPAQVAELTTALKRSGFQSIKETNKKLLENFANLVDDDDDLKDL